MNTTVFYKKISILSGCLLIFLIALSQFSSFQDTLYFSVSSTVVFFIFTILVFHIGLRATKSPNKNLFTGVAISSIFMKLVFILIFLFTYQAVVEPTSKHYLFPFILIYLVYTIFETMVMMRLSKPSE